jgi:hypothetical protein
MTTIRRAFALEARAAARWIFADGSTVSTRRLITSSTGWRRHGEGGDHGLQLMQAPPSHSGAADTDDGAAIVFTPADPADLEVLRTFLRGRATRLSSMTCS